MRVISLCKNNKTIDFITVRTQNIQGGRSPGTAKLSSIK